MGKKLDLISFVDVSLPGIITNALGKHCRLKKCMYECDLVLLRETFALRKEWHETILIK